MIFYRLVKKEILFLLAVIITIPLWGQLDQPGKRLYHYKLPALHFTLANNYLTSPHRYTPEFISLPYREDSLVCFGSLVTLSVIQKDNLTRFKPYSGIFFMDADSTRKPMLQLQDLHVKLVRNGKLLREGPLNNLSTEFIDQSVYREDGKPVLPARLVANDSLEVGDVLTITISTTQGQPVLFFRVKREKMEPQPFLGAFQQDSSLNEVDFIHRQLLTTNDLFTGFSYADWPGPGLQMGNQEFKAGTNLAFYFRRETNNGNDSVYLYRLISSKNKDTAWKKTNWRVLVPSLLPNTRYQLEIKYAGGHGSVSTYRFHTPSFWYQTGWFRVLMASLLVALILSGWLLYAHWRNRKKWQQQRLEMRALYAQINPHFIFNAMSSIQGLMNDGQIEKANTYLAGFAGLLRGAILHGRKEWVTLQEELKSIENYIVLEQLRFNFEYTIFVSEEIPRNMEVPPLLAQPLIENAVKHGLAGLGAMGRLKLTIAREGKDILFSVTDNGPGFDAQQPVQGQGLRLTSDRIDLFNKIYKPLGIGLRIDKVSNGTICTIIYKNWPAE